MTDAFSSFGKPSVLFLGESHDLSFSLVKKLLERSCKVFLLAKNISTWKAPLIIFKDDKNLKTIKENEITKIERLDYLIYTYGFSRAISKSVKSVNSEITSDLTTISQKLSGVRSKNLILLPAIYGILKPTNFVGKRIYYSETIGIHIPIDNKYFIYALLKRIADNKKIFLPQKESLLMPISSEAASEKILEILFSLGFPNEITLTGEAISPHQLVEKFNTQGLEIDKKKKRYREYALSTLGEKISLGEVTGIEKVIESIASSQKTKATTIKKNLTGFRRLAFFIVLLVLLPFLSLITSAGFFGASIVLFKNGENNLGRNTLKATKAFASIASVGLGILSGIPKLERVMDLPNTSSEVLVRSSTLALRTFSLSLEAKSLLANFFGENSYDVSKHSENMSNEIEYMYKESGFILSEVNSQPFVSKFITKIVSIDEIDRIRGVLIPASQIIDNLPDLLGESQPKKYLILFQNNMELRPTGGYIGSFSIITVSGGRLSNIEVWDVFEADGQLKGHVEPPAPIKNYLGEANWFLRDSNWDPDFNVSAARAEWFLDKEIDEKVDGVIAIDLEFVKSLISLTGSLYIDDYEVLINDRNLYEVVQREVEEDFFPGSTKKSSFLTALSKALIENLKLINEGSIVSFTLSTLQNFESRHAQIFIHQKSTNDLLNTLGWDGAFPDNYYCGEGCYSDIVGVVEANVGVNKANLYISRAIDVSVRIEGGAIKRELTLSLKNNADASIGKKGIYKVYVRAFGPQEATFEKIKLIRYTGILEVLGEEQIVRNRKEVGVLVLVSPQESSEIKFSWQSPLPINIKEKGEYALTVRKQGGVGEFPISVEISNIDSSLTQEPGVSYNAFLARDFVSRIYW